MPPADAAHSGKASLEIANAAAGGPWLWSMSRCRTRTANEVVLRLRQGLPDILLIAINGLVRDLSEEQKAQKRPAVRIPSAPPTSQRETAGPLRVFLQALPGAFSDCNHSVYRGFDKRCRNALAGPEPLAVLDDAVGRGPFLLRGV